MYDRESCMSWTSLYPISKKELFLKSRQHSWKIFVRNFILFWNFIKNNSFTSIDQGFFKIPSLCMWNTKSPNNLIRRSFRISLSSSTYHASPFMFLNFKGTVFLGIDKLDVNNKVISYYFSILLASSDISYNGPWYQSLRRMVVYFDIVTRKELVWIHGPYL